LTSELDAGGGHYSNDLSEVDLNDPENVKVTVADPAGAVLVHLGNEQFLERFKIYLSHVSDWRQQFQKLKSVDLRYDGQIIVNPDDGAPEQRFEGAVKFHRHGISPRRHGAR
jgi:cell division protein FtsQ